MHSFHAWRYSANYEPYEHVLSGCIHFMGKGTVQSMNPMNMFFKDAFIWCLKIQCISTVPLGVKCWRHRQLGFIMDYLLFQDAFIWRLRVQYKVWSIWTCSLRMHSFDAWRYSAKCGHVLSRCAIIGCLKILCRVWTQWSCSFRIHSGYIHLMLAHVSTFHCTSRHQMLTSLTIWDW